MTRPKASSVYDSPAYFTNHAKVMDAALAAPGLHYRLPTRGAAINFRQNCYRYRNLLRKLEFQRLFGTPGMAPSTVYDCLTISFAGASDSSTLVFSIADEGTIVDSVTGEPI